jgi:hypothetical protein
MRTAGKSDTGILKEFSVAGGTGGEIQNSEEESGVRDKVMLVNANLAAANGDRMLMVHSGCIELIKDFEQVTYTGRQPKWWTKSAIRRGHIFRTLWVPRMARV